MEAELRKEELHTLIKRRADELAATGRFNDYQEIEAELRFSEGFSAARTVLDNRTTRMILDRTCAAAKARIVNA